MSAASATDRARAISPVRPGAIGDHEIEEFMRGYEPTAWYLNEADLLASEVYQWARSRWGRFPDMAEGGPSWWGMLMDCNAPQIGTWLYDDIFLGQPADVDLFRQPSGLDPNAENKANLPPGYYEEMAKGMPEALVNRLIRNKPGFSLAGKPVHGEFNDQRHVADRVLEPVPGLPLYVGFDAGLDPAAVIGQKLGMAAGSSSTSWSASTVPARSGLRATSEPHSK